MEAIIVKVLIILVLLLAWLGILILVAFLAVILEAKLYNPQPRKTRQRHRRMVTHTPADPPWPAYLPSPKVACNQAIEKLMYQAVERFDDPEGDL